MGIDKDATTASINVSTCHRSPERQGRRHIKQNLSFSFEIVSLESIKGRHLLGGKRSYIPVNPIYQPNLTGRARRRIISVINTRESLWETKRMSWWWSGAIGAAKASDFNPFSVQFSVVSAFSLFGLGK